jgi:NAD-dependent oxidoreductase involved in siderophore biosynthesis
MGAVLATTHQGTRAVVGAVLATTQQKVGAAQQKLGSQQAESGDKLQRVQTAAATQTLIGTLQIICAVIGVVVTVFTLAAASQPIIVAVIAMVAAIGTMGVVSAQAPVRAVLQIARQGGGPSLNLAADVTVMIISIILLTILVFLLAGLRACEWERTMVLAGRRGWKIRLR